MPRDANDAWVECACGGRHWGLAGAAGLLLIHDGGGDDGGVPRVALQLRSAASHQGGSWALPGGAIGVGEDVYAAARRESWEEARIGPFAWEPLAEHVEDHGPWRYTTVIGHTRSTRPVLEAADGESEALEWVPIDDVARLPLHPAFAAAWPGLRRLAEARPTLLVDAANVVGSRPDGWWRDRPGATSRLLRELAAGRRATLPAAWFGLGGEADGVLPRVVVVTEGLARAAADPDPDDRVEVVRAAGSGDDEIAHLAGSLAAPPTDRAAADGATRPLVVVTADRGLRERLPATAQAIGPQTLRDYLDAVAARST